MRVRSRNSTLDFHPVSSGDGCEGSRGSERRAFLDLFRTSWRGNCSLFSWADKGQWGQAVTDGQEPRPDEDWFRIGFEPVFVDFSKTESWVFLVTLVEVRVRGLQEWGLKNLRGEGRERGRGVMLR